MKKIRIIFIFIALIISGYKVKAQQSTLSNNSSYTGIYLNPAFTAMDVFWKATNTYNDYSLGFEDGSKTFFLSVNGPISQAVKNRSSFSTNESGYTSAKQSFNHGLGFYFLFEKFGAQQSYQPTLTYAQHLRLSRKFFIGFGVSAALQSMRYDLSKLNFDQKNDEAYLSLLNDGASCNFLGINAGTLLYSTKFRLGFSMNNLTKGLVRFGGNEKFPEPTIAYSLNIGYKAKVNNQFDMVFAYESMSNLNQNSDHRLNLKMIYDKSFGAGITYRPTKSIGFGVDLRYQNYFLTYTFDYNTSAFSKIAYTGHQLGIKFFFKDIKAFEAYSW